MKLKIALDGMGGDHAPEIVVDGAVRVLAEADDVRFIIFGDEGRLQPLLDQHPACRGRIEIRHTSQAVAADAKPSSALRQGRGTSMRLAINAVKECEAAAAVSAGNTGALMAMAKFVLKTLPGIDRPAICAIWPARDRFVVALDLGANIDCSLDNLVQFGVMGAVFARALLGIATPSVALLNVGTEELKGDEIVRSAASVLRRLDGPLEFKGFVEGTDVLTGAVDVVVTDGFTGNVALKIAEGTAQMVMDELRAAFGSSLRGRLGYAVARPALRPLKHRFDPRLYNGAMFLGLSGIVVKSHGGTDGIGFAHAVQLAIKLVRERTNEKIIEEMNVAGLLHEPQAQAAAS